MKPIPGEAPAAVHGVGLFETILVRAGRCVLLDAHIDRLIASAASLALASPDRARVAALAEKASAAGGAGEWSLRITWLALARPLDRASSWRLDAALHPVPEATLLRRRRGRVVLLPPDFARTLPRVKSTSYLPSVLALRFAGSRGADEALFVDARGRVLEGSTTNIFAVSAGRLVTPPDDGSILPGVMRAWVIAHASSLGVSVRYRRLTIDDLLGGSFLTGSLTTIASVRSAEGRRSADVEAIVGAFREAFGTSF